jgi:hypothetical protein
MALVHIGALLQPEQLVTKSVKFLRKRKNLAFAGAKYVATLCLAATFRLCIPAPMTTTGIVLQNKRQL